jgi:hypothetical protein
MLGDLTNDAIRIIYKEVQKDKNKQKLAQVLNIVSGMILKTMLPYMYAILAILVVMILMNFFQFYFYLRYFIFVKKQLPIHLLTGSDITNSHVRI